ncbi:MAG: hypothetical protein JRI23_01795 [Deltaproteobacteria bacterium]|jgi:hypothetical protein|nr:hypothetical protein [Deltaproteobacteria bacterium]MBW2530207.1 hypothetical protein [Deltaproteobacteria bacterium]
MRRFSRWVARSAFAAALVWAAGACNPYGDYCEAMMDCEGGNDADVEACIEEAEGAEEVASLWDCDEYFDELFTCVEEKSDCESDYYTPGDSCQDEEEDYEACM